MPVFQPGEEVAFNAVGFMFGTEANMQDLVECFTNVEVKEIYGLAIIKMYNNICNSINKTFFKSVSCYF